MISLDIDVDARRAMARLAAMKTRSKDFRKVFNWARRELERENAANFASNGGRSGATWAPLDPGYGSWKASRFPGAPLLVRSGNLFRSLVNLSGPPNSMGRMSAEFGTNVRYAKFHENGTEHMPRREIVFTPPLFARELAKHAAEYVSDGLI